MSFYYPMVDVTGVTDKLTKMGYLVHVERTTVERLIVSLPDVETPVASTIISDASGFRQVASHALSHLFTEGVTNK